MKRILIILFALCLAGTAKAQSALEIARAFNDSLIKSGRPIKAQDHHAVDSVILDAVELASGGASYTAGWGMLLTGTAFRIDSSKAATKRYVDSLVAAAGGGGGGGGTVTSVAVAVPSGFSASGSPITGAGTITISAPGNATTQYINGAGGASLVANLPVSTATQTALNLKANLASPALTGTPTAPTAANGTNTTQIATTAFVQDAVASGTAGVASWNGRTGIVVPAANDYSFAQLSGLPTTLAGYGITDPIVLTSGSYANPSWITSLAWSKITSPPTTLAGYGITDAAASSHTHTFASLTSKPTTLSGYGITDAAPIAAAVPTGGASGQFLMKNSSSNYDLTWTSIVSPSTSDNNLTVSAGVISTKKAVQTLTDGATVTFDLANGYNAKVTLGGNRTLVIANAQAGQYFTLVVIQDGTGSRTLTLPMGSLVIGGGTGAVTLTTTGGAKDVLCFYYDGSSFYITAGLNYN